MSAIVPAPISPPPGVVVTETSRVAEGRWIAPYDKLRFVRGRPQKIGGNVRATTTAMSGTPRATLCWQDFLQNGYIACGTYRKLYAFDNSFTLNDITPYQTTGTLTNNPFTTTSGSNVVTVTLAFNNSLVGDTFNFSGAAAFNGVTMNGAFLVNSIVDTNHFTVLATTNASGNGSGGGAAVTYQHEISVGTEQGTYGQGWGAGGWGQGTWGTARPNSITYYQPRVWSFDNFGQVLVATYNGGGLWFFDPTQTQPWPRAVATFLGLTVTGAPTNCQAMFVSPEEFVFTLCSGLIVNVSAQGDPTTWIPATTNTAFARTLNVGSQLVAGRALQPFVSMVWSDAAAYLFQYTGSQFLYNSSLVGRDCGLISPNAAVTVDGFAYWMGPDNFYSYNGVVSPLANVEDIRAYVFNSLPKLQFYQCAGIYVPKYHEIWWFYPTTGNSQPSNYVIFHINDQCWSIGTANFYSSAGVTAGRASGSHFSAGDTSPYMAGTDGYLYNHDPASQNYDDNGHVLTWQLTLAPYSLNTGLQNLDVEGIRFDFFGQVGAISATVNTYDELTDLTPMDTQTQSVPATQSGLTDYRVGGRYLSLSMSGATLGGYMRFGAPIAYTRPSAKRR